MHDRLEPARLPSPRVARSLLSGLVPLLFALCLVSASRRAEAQTQDMRVQILNGKTGRPVTNAHVLLWRDTNHGTLDGAKSNPGLTTDGEGYAPVPNTDAPFLLVYVENHQPCSKTFDRTFTVADIRAKGVVSENSCRAHIHMYAEAGILRVFVRDETFLEKMKH